MRANKYTLRHSKYTLTHSKYTLTLSKYTLCLNTILSTVKLCTLKRKIIHYDTVKNNPIYMITTLKITTVRLQMLSIIVMECKMVLKILLVESCHCHAVLTKTAHIETSRNSTVKDVWFSVGFVVGGQLYFLQTKNCNECASRLIYINGRFIPSLSITSDIAKNIVLDDFIYGNMNAQDIEKCVVWQIDL